jgi:MGT family glycosyltransferase
MGAKYKFLVVTMPAAGHVGPFVPAVRALIERGHEVLWYGSRHYADKIEASGATFTPLEKMLDIGDGDVEKHFPERKNYKGLEQVKYDFKHVFIDTMPGMLEDLNAILDRFPADVLLTDPTVIAGRVLNQKRVIPWAILNITVLAISGRDVAPFGLGLPPAYSRLGHLRNHFLRGFSANVIFRDVQQHFDQVADKHGWQRQPFMFDVSRDLFLQPSAPEFEYPRTDLPPQVHFIGPMLPDTPTDFTEPEWWGEISAKKRPVVLVTQGTVANLNPDLIQPVLDGLAQEDMTVIATTGGKTAEEMGIRAPANALVVPFVPFTQLMPYVDVMVTNGGYGGVTISLAHGVPLVVGGTTEDKMEVSARVAYTGVGINLRTATPTPAQAREAARSVLQNSTYREKARTIQAAMARLDGPTNAANLLERLAATGQPVTTASPTPVASVSERVSV